MTKLFQSGRTQNRLPQYLALFLVAGLVIIPLYATVVGRPQERGGVAHKSLRSAQRLDLEELLECAQRSAALATALQLGR